MRQALDDAAAAEERGAVAKARWDRRSDKITAFTLELTQLDYTSPAGGQAVGVGGHTQITAVVAGLRNFASSLGFTDPAQLQGFDQQLLAMCTMLQANAARLPPPPPPPPPVVLGSGAAAAAMAPSSSEQ